MFVLELDLNDQFTILGTSIMLANALQEQDPMYLKINENLVVLEAGMIERHEHYISSGYPDLGWINLNIFLNKDSPLKENPYAPFTCLCEINSPLSCDNAILATLVGYKEKKYVTFCMDKEYLEKVIKEYLERKINNDDESKNIMLDGVQKKLLN